MEKAETAMYYRSLNAYLRETFGRKVYKLSLSAGCTCPNRDGTLGTRGCTFCSGSGEFAASSALPIPEQIAQAKRLISAKAGKDAAFIAYFQDYSNTYAPVSYLRLRFEAALAQPDVGALSIATRPDCLPPEILELLSELREKKPVWVELGLQTIHETTARAIRRGYPLSVYDDAVKTLKARHIEVVTHQILGLPGETQDMMVETARYIGRSGADGIKLHLLHVLAGTDLAEDYAAGRFDVLSLDTYITALEACLRVLPRNMVIHRMTGDGAKRELLAPLWSADKKRVLNEINRRFLSDDLEQGSELIA